MKKTKPKQTTRAKPKKTKAEIKKLLEKAKEKNEGKVNGHEIIVPDGNESIKRKDLIQFFDPEQKKTMHGYFIGWSKSKPDYANIRNEFGGRLKVHKTKFQKVSNVTVRDGKVVVDPTAKWDVNKKFEFLQAYIKMVVEKKMISLIIAGEGGLGKTYMVMMVLNLLGKIEGEDYIIIKGYSTARGLYNTLYAHSSKLIIFDDTDSILDGEVSANILASALDSYDRRIVHWVKSEKFAAEEDAPPNFEFTGNIIFISNLPKYAIPQKLLSRANNIDLTMSTLDKIKRMETILPAIKPEVPVEQRQEAFDELKKHAEKCRDFNLRTLIKAIEIRTSGETEWADMIEFMACS